MQRCSGNVLPLPANEHCKDSYATSRKFVSKSASSSPASSVRGTKKLYERSNYICMLFRLVITDPVRCLKMRPRASKAVQLHMLSGDDHVAEDAEAEDDGGGGPDADNEFDVIRSINVVLAESAIDSFPLILQWKRSLGAPASSEKPAAEESTEG
ncbi:hypothetical protein F0562_034429 [Nyssa sinensis]|uniref:Uncharacterized protein n=1 Tax=Nyssa sinensis TaxID=561372 RepID=A0A5J5AKE8_9ASTE|nr:hypothetical protein F0562_034429 [Nyssa sinensis]